MVIIAEVSYPTESARQVATRFLETPDIPEFLTRKGPYVSTNLEHGVFVVTIYELDKSKLAEGLEYLGQSMAVYFGVPEFKYSIKPFMDVEEALKLLDMA